VAKQYFEKRRQKDWRKVLKEATGEDISTRAMMEYFKPLMSWLEEQKQRAARSLGISCSVRCPQRNQTSEVRNLLGRARRMR